MAKLSDHVAVVIGASSGIGRATAAAFGDAGASVVLSARREGPLRELAKEVERRGGTALVAPADVTRAEDLEEVARQAAGRFGRIDTWVNNAAVILYGRVEEVPVEAWHRVIETNVLGVYHGVRAVLPWLREQGKGTIVNVASVLSKVPAPFQSSYVASKHAVRALSDCVRQELLDTPNIAVCTILPGAIDTPFFQHGGNYTGKRAKPPRPVLDPDRVAAAIVSCARNPRREVHVGASTRGGIVGRLLAPRLTERAAARVMEEEQFLDEPQELGPGNLFEPVAEGTEVSGGWRDDGAGATRTMRRVVAVGAAGLGAAAALRRLRSDD